MENAWEILIKELEYFGFKYIKPEVFSIPINEQPRAFHINRLINDLQLKIHENGKLFEEIWKDAIELLDYSCPNNENEPIDENMKKLFTASVKNLVTMAEFLTTNFSFINKELKNKIHIKCREAVDKDFASFPRQIILTLPDYKISLDYMFRKMSLLAYIISLLKYSKKGQEELSKIVVKTAAGISGPWANLDLPMQERVYDWEEIDSDIRGQEKQKQKQRRYWMWLEYYNNTKRPGEGNFWRELRNEPYSWDNRFTDSPYPGRDVLTKW